MKKRTALILAFIINTQLHNACAVSFPKDTVDKPDKLNNYYEFKNTKLIKKLGEFQIKSFDERTIIFEENEGDLTDKNIFDLGDTLGFNIDKLYRCKFDNSISYSYFRMYWQAPFQGETTLYVHWIITPATTGKIAQIDIVDVPFIQKGRRKVCTIGDSQTWLFHGEEYWYYWSQLNPNFKFIGNRTDYHGFGHEGEGGNSSRQVIERMSRFLKADIYVLLIGTNDRKDNLTIEQTINNIDSITRFLKGKNNESSIYVLTIPPCTEVDRDHENRQINSLLKERYSKPHDDILVVDVEALFRAKQNWTDYFIDGLHPNDAGYRLLVDFLNREIQ
jgi:lysophospholipase L1-like esterase